MGIKVTTVGNGKFTIGEQSDVVIDYSISESATPISVADTSGEIPALNISAQSNSVDTLGNTHPNSKLLIDNSITIVDDGAFPPTPSASAIVPSPTPSISPSGSPTPTPTKTPTQTPTTTPTPAPGVKF